MKKSYTVKNATFVFNDEVKFKKKIFNYNPETYDELEASKEFTDGIEHCGEKKSTISAILFFGTIIFTTVYFILKHFFDITIPEFIFIPIVTVGLI